MSTTLPMTKNLVAEAWRIARFGVVGVAATGTQAAGSLLAA